MKINQSIAISRSIISEMNIKYNNKVIDDNHKKLVEFFFSKT
jgi:hypothetical protein